MMIRMKIGLPATMAAILLSGMFAWLSPAAAEQFRVDNKIYLGDDKEPQIESSTIFFGDVVYDYLVRPSEVTIFDHSHDRFVLLDLSRRVKTEVSTQHVREFNARLKQWASSQPDAFTKFLSAPEFETQYDHQSGELTYSSPWVIYRLTTVDAENESVARQYAEFSDWYSQLNTMLNPGARPPFARMQVNAGLEARLRFPREVTLTLRPRDGLLAKRITIRSEHQLVRQLVQSDRDRIAQTDQFLAIFTPVNFTEYQKKMGD